MIDQNTELDKLNELIQHGYSIDVLIHQLDLLYPGKLIFSTSFSEEDQALSHFIYVSKSPVTVFTLDTGRLFPETYSTWTRTLEKYKFPIKSYHPDASILQAFIESNGPNSFYESIDQRKACCRIRKVEPLKQALKGFSIWITGIRAVHSPDREHMPMVEWDETHQLIKIHPLLHWTNDELKLFIKKNEVPYNSLHDKGFVSIGCAPCTRAIQPGEEFRAGRWWWEDASKKECGLHVHQS